MMCLLSWGDLVMSYNSFAAVYDELTKNVDYKSRAEYIAKILEKYNIKDGLLLDLACGTGSLSIELSKSGFEVIGTDASFDMLSEAQNKAMENGENIMFLCQRMEETDLYGSVRAIVCALDSINHLTDYELVKKTFKNLKNFLDTDGIIIFDANTIYKHRNVLANNIFIYDEKNVFCAWRNTLQSDNKTVNINLDFFVKDDENYFRCGENFNEVAYTDEELTEAVEYGGFKVLSRFAESTFDLPTETTERVTYILGRSEAYG